MNWRPGQVIWVVHRDKGAEWAVLKVGRKYFMAEKIETEKIHGGHGITEQFHKENGWSTDLGGYNAHENGRGYYAFHSEADWIESKRRRRELARLEKRLPRWGSVALRREIETNYELVDKLHALLDEYGLDKKDEA